jgi:Xaa-Pro aminopeptidase
MEALVIPTEEYQVRHKKIQQFLESEGLGMLLAYSPPMEHKWGQTGHVSYLSGWANHDRIIDSIVAVPARGRPALLFAGMPYMKEQVLEVSPIDDVRIIQAVDPNAVAMSSSEQGGPRSLVEEASAILEENGLEGEGVAVVGLENMPLPTYQVLARDLEDRLTCGQDIVAQLRSTKSPEELELMRRAAALSDLGFDTMLELARPGMRGIEILAEMERVVRREGADHAKYWMASGPPPDWGNVRLDLKPHMRVLKEGDLMASCSYVCYKGYWCHGQRTGTLQRACAELQQMCEITRGAQDAGLAKMVAGTPVSKACRAIRETASQSGWEIEGGRFGHGIGLDYSEQPRMTEGNEQPLQAGTTAVIHTTFRDPRSGKMFVPLGDVCCVGENGPELLMSFQRTPFIAGL